MKKNLGAKLLKATLVTAALSITVSVQAAAVYDFDIEWNGSVVSLDAGSDDPIGQVLFDGDSFNYNVQTAGNDYWKVDITQGYFPFLAFAIAESADRTATVSLNLLLDGISQFTSGPSGIVNSFVHMGTNTVSLTSGLMFDEIILDYSLTSAIANESPPGLPPEEQIPTTSTITSYRFNPQHSIPGGFTDGISYNREPTGSIPTPASLALFGLGLAGLGWSKRRYLK